MNNLLNITNAGAGPGRGAARATTAWRITGLANLHQVYWNLPTEALYEEIVFRREGQHHASGPDRRQHRQAHGALGQRQVRRAGSQHGGARLVGRVQPPVQPGQVQRAVRPHAGLPAGARRVRAGLLRRGRSAVTGCRSASSPRWPGTACSRATCSSCPQTSEEYRRHVPEFTVICVPVLPGHAADRRHAHRARSSSSTSSSGCASSATRPTPARSRSRSSPS